MLSVTDSGESASDDSILMKAFKPWVRWQWLFLTALAWSSPAQEKAPQQNQPQRPPPAQVPEGVKALRNLEYVPGGHERQKLDLYLPERGTKLPLIVWVHGGAWLGGSKDGCPAIPMTRDGFAVASINYRLSQHAIFPAQIEDCKASIRWLRANATKYNFNAERIGVWGSSAGGHLVALLGTAGDVKEFDSGENLNFSSRVQAVCDWFGPTDFTRMSKFESTMNHDAANSPESKLIGGPIQENKEKVAKADPISYVTRDDPPFLIMHGDKDPLVPFNQSELLNDALKKTGVEVTFHPVKGGGHGGPGWQNPEIRELVRDFFKKHLKQ